MVSPVRTLHPTRKTLSRAAAALRAGKLVAFPTETVYGLGADATSDRAVAAIYAAKRRPRHNPLIVHVADMRMARSLVWFDRQAETLARLFWPGPLTLVLKRRAGARLSRLIGQHLRTVAIRMPDDKVARALIRAAGRPLAAPSANRSGAVSPTRAAHVRSSLGGRVALIVDGGPCRVGLESTVVDLSGKQAVLLRPGGLPLETLQEAIGPIKLDGGDDDRPASPGRLAAHYAPRLPLRLNASIPRQGEAYLAFGKAPRDDRTLNLSPSGSLDEAAANLFTLLQALDRPEFHGIAVAPIPTHGLGRAINDRLRRAAASHRQR
jgi:L-threonylcarbamoyladenylate synthase